MRLGSDHCERLFAHRRMPVSPRRSVQIAIAVATSAALVATGADVARSAPPSSASVYIVQLAAPPVAAYNGGVSGIPATRPVQGEKVNLGSTAAKAYRAHLRSERQRT